MTSSERSLGNLLAPGHDAGAFPRADRDLSRRLEGLEARANVAYVDSRAHLTPDSGATWTEVNGAFAMFDGVGSPLTQTFGVGLSDTWQGESFEALDAFFFERGSDVFHEVSPAAGPDVLAQLVSRGYLPCELTSVLYRPLPGSAPLPVPDDIDVRVAGPSERTLWAELSYDGWAEFEAAREFVKQFGPLSVGARGLYPFLAWVDGVPAATGSLCVHDGLALLAGASTVPAYRQRGAQRALLAGRLYHASALACTLAMMCAAPASASQRNAEAQGFRIAYTRIKWHKPLPGRS